MRALCVVGWCPLPAADADDHRLLSILEAWASMGALDVVVRGATTEAQRTRLHDHLGGATVDPLPEADERARTGKLGWFVHRDVPCDVAELDPAPARRRVRRLLDQRERPDVVFASDPFMSWLLRSALPPVPWLLDVPHVQGPSPWSVPVTSVGAALRVVRDRSMFELLAIDRAARFELHQAGIAHVATVRSGTDREALGSPTAVVLPDVDIARAFSALARATVAHAGSYAAKGWR